MSNMQFDIVIPSEVKLRHQLKDCDQRFNKETKMFEYWDAQSQSWIPTTSAGDDNTVGDYITRSEFENHKVDPAGHLVATAERSGFIDNISFSKLKQVETNLSPDPTELLDSILSS